MVLFHNGLEKKSLSETVHNEHKLLSEIIKYRINIITSKHHQSLTPADVVNSDWWSVVFAGVAVGDI